MVRRLAVVAVAVLVVASFAFAGEVMEAEGKVKSVSGNTVTVTGTDGGDSAFDANSDSLIKAKGASHKMKDLEEAGKAKTLDNFVKADQKVTIQYWEKDGKAWIKEIRVHGPAKP